MLYNEVSPEHVVLSIDNKYNFSGTGQSFAPILHAYMDTRFLPGVHADPHSEGCMKEVVDYTLQGLRRNFPNILESSQLWTVISEYPNRHFIHNVRKTHLPNTVKFYDAFYHGTKEEKIASCDCFFESSALRVTTCIFSNRGESSSEVAVRLCGGRKMLDVHNPRRYKHYSNKRAYLHEEAKTLFKRELRMQTYIDIIKPSCLEGIFFLNICRGNKAHIVAHALGMKVVNIVSVEMLENAKTKMNVAVDWSLQRWYQEGKVASQDMEEEEGHIEMDSNIERERISKRANDT